MTDPGYPTASVAPAKDDSASPETIHRQLQSLRLLFVATLMALLVLSVAVDFYLWYQVKMVRKELTTTYAFLEDYQKNKEPLLNKMVAGLQKFSQSHADVKPLLERYSIKPFAGDAASPAASAPAAEPVKPAR